MKINGIKVYNKSMTNLIFDLEVDLFKKRKSVILAINPEKVLGMNKSPKLISILHQTNYVIPDGIGIILAGKIKKKPFVERITGIDTMLELCSLASNKRYKVFLFGAKQESLLATQKNLRDKYPNINIVGAIDGYDFNDSEVVKKINLSKPDILFVALGSPRQEEWIFSNLDKLEPMLIQGVGGSFDVIGGKIKRAPLFIRKMGLEWFYRLLKEPKRIFRQVGLIKFVFIILFRKDVIT